MSDLIDAVGETIGALEDGSMATPAVRDPRRATIGTGRIASTPAPEAPARLMHPSGVSRREYITATKHEIQGLRDDGLHAEADRWQQALNRYIDGETGPGSSASGVGSSTTVPPAVPADKYAGSDLKEAFQKAVSNKGDVTALKGTIGINSTPHSVRGAVMTSRKWGFAGSRV